MREKGYLGYILVLPAVLLIVVFSLWPIIKSLSYTFFDYRLNDQQKSGLYMDERFNYDLFQESQLYISFFLEEDRSVITNAGDQQKVDILLQKVEDLDREIAGMHGVQQISSEQKEKFIAHYEAAHTTVQELTSSYDLPNGDSLLLIVEDLKNSILSSNFIGVDGYKKVLTDKRIGIALVNTVVFTIASVFMELILGLGLAIIMNRAMRGKGFIRTTALIPWAIPTAVAALIWSYLYDGSSGIVAHFFENLGIIEDSRVLLLTGPGAMLSAIFADVWKTTPYMALLLLAGLQTIPSSLYEASAIDGANRIKTFFRITLPLLKPSILVALLFRTLDAFRVFDLIYVLTGGGPGGATETLSIYAYKSMFAQTNFGYGSVVVIVMFVCVAAIATLYVKVLGANLMEKN